MLSIARGGWCTAQSAPTDTPLPGFYARRCRLCIVLHLYSELQGGHLVWLGLDMIGRRAESVSITQDNHMDTAATITAAADVLVASNPLWSRGRILLQTASHAALLYNGALCSVWHGEVVPL